jgi:hypothetical protein
VRDHQHGHIDDRDHIGRAQFTRERRKADLVAMIIVDDDVGCSDEIKCLFAAGTSQPLRA